MESKNRQQRLLARNLFVGSLVLAFCYDSGHNFVYCFRSSTPDGGIAHFLCLFFSAASTTDCVFSNVLCVQVPVSRITR